MRSDSSEESAFNAAEARILSFVLDALPSHEGEILQRQLEWVKRVQRQHRGRLVVAFYATPNEVPPLPYAGYEYGLAKVIYRSSSRSNTTWVVLKDGRLMSLEGDVPEELHDIDALERVMLHPGDYSSEADRIDEEEHDE